MKQNTANNP